MEFFGWREFQNRKQVGSLAGLTPTPHASGTQERERGIGKDGSRWVRGVAIEQAWAWLRFQPESELSQWYQERFGKGDERLRKIGIVALARKLLIALWRYVETGLLPEGAVIASSVHFRSEDPSRSARTLQTPRANRGALVLDARSSTRIEGRAGNRIPHSKRKRPGRKGDSQRGIEGIQSRTSTTGVDSTAYIEGSTR
jgi:hypothetical protein